jgi:hypothetical protein
LEQKYKEQKFVECLILISEILITKMETTDLHKRDFSTISPSARALLLLKGLTNIPFARKAAELMMHPDKYEPDFDNKDFGFWTRVVHFEYRYSSVNQLLSALPVKNVLELSSGFSFRGLDMVRQKKFII